MGGRPDWKIGELFLLSGREIRSRRDCNGRASRISWSQDLPVKPHQLSEESFSLRREYSCLFLPTFCSDPTRAPGEEFLWSLELCHCIWWHDGLATAFSDLPEAKIGSTRLNSSHL